MSWEALVIQIAIHWPNSSLIIKEEGWNTGEGKCQQRQFFFLLFLIYCTQVRPPDSWRSQIGKIFLINCVQPPSQTTGSHKTEFVFDVRQFGVLQRAQLHFSTPVLYTEQLKTTSKKNPTRKNKKTKNKTKKELTALQIDNSSEV